MAKSLYEEYTGSPLKNSKILGGSLEDQQQVFINFLNKHNLDINDPYLKLKLKMLAATQRSNYQEYSQLPHFSKADNWLNSRFLDMHPRAIQE